MKLPNELPKGHVRILVADDEMGMRDLLSMELSAQGYQVVTASNGLEALEQVRRQRFDLVISDIKMPQMDGMTLLTEIKKIDSKIEVIMATGHATIELAVTAMKNGAYDFILKPFHLDELNSVIEKVLERKELKTLVGLYEASRAIFSTIELDKLLEVVMDISQKVLGADEGSLMLLNETGKLSIAASRGLPDEIARQVQIEIGERVAGRVAQEKRGRLLINGIEKYEEFKGLAGKANIYSSIVCPLICHDELLGVLNLNRSRANENFSVADFQSASIFASQAALAIQNAKLYSTLQGAYQQLEKTQEQLLQSEKLASIGRLVAGVAHEINNPLTSVIGYSQLAQDTPTMDEVRRQLSVIYSEAMRCSKIVKDLLLFSRRQKPKCQNVDAGKLLEDVLKGVKLELEKRKVTVRRNDQSAPVNLQADPHLLTQVFNNIVVNAYQILEGIQGERLIEIKTGQSGDNVRISFTDNGPGIPKANLRKVFDPFYTTKEVGKGTGLGLSLSYGIIHDHGGKLWVESAPGQGTTFHVELPSKTQGEIIAPLPAAPFKEVSFQFPQGLRILLAEDEESIRQLIATMLGEQKCDLSLVADGEEALNMIHRKEYDLILCDYRMPKLDGVQLFEAVRELKPALANHFLFITGSTEFAKTFDTDFKGKGACCLPKPFTREEFMAAVAAVLRNGKNGLKS